MITDYYNGLENGYPGVAKILNLIRNYYDRLGLEREVREYIKKYSSY
jgi:hypothetical protein